MIEFLKNHKISNQIIKGLHKQDITKLTKVQEKVIPLQIQNRDLVIQSETGTGKTLAYLIPLFEKIDQSIKEMQAIILVPTHELGIQVLRQIELLATNANYIISSLPIIGKVNIKRQIDNLKKKPHIIVGSPGRILELIKMKKISSHTIKTIIIDEADNLVSKHNIDTIKAIIKTTQKDRQLLMVSASITAEAKDYATQLMKDPSFIVANDQSKIPDTIEHLYFMSSQRNKIDVIRKVIRILNPKKALIFVNGREEVDILVERLNYHHIKTRGLHGNKWKSERKQIVDQFKSGVLKYLVVTDIAARGLDIKDITHIINMGVPGKSRDYLHRVGRTGRIGKKGVAITLVADYEVKQIEMFKRAFKIQIIEKKTVGDTIVTVKK
ncbi:MAG: DEAD/DEAH box helicase [Clostridiales bacterium]|nr:DEAD/DEAH box helicase [Clostridiales bacterium]